MLNVERKKMSPLRAIQAGRYRNDVGTVGCHDNNGVDFTGFHSDPLTSLTFKEMPTDIAKSFADTRLSTHSLDHNNDQDNRQSILPPSTLYPDLLISRKAKWRFGNSPRSAHKNNALRLATI